MTNYNTVRNILVPLMKKYLTIECITDEESGRWVTATGYLDTMGGASGKTGTITMNNIMGASVAGRLPIQGIATIIRDGEIIWKKDENEAPAEKCRCSGIVFFYGDWLDDEFYN